MHIMTCSICPVLRNIIGVNGFIMGDFGTLGGSILTRKTSIVYV